MPEMWNTCCICVSVLYQYIRTLSSAVYVVLADSNSEGV